MNIKKIIFITMIFLFSICNVYAEKKILVTLNKCVDGDTAYFNYKGEVLKTRFLAIDTPEISDEVEPYGKEASDYTCNELKNAIQILLEYDDNSNKLDKYNRHLVWVFVDDTLLQSKIIKNGYAEIAYLYGDYKYIEDLYKDLEYAKENKLGMWSDNIESDSLIIKIITIIAFVFALYKLIKKQIKKSKKFMS